MVKKTKTLKTTDTKELLEAYSDRGFLRITRHDEYPDNSNFSTYVSRVMDNTEYVTGSFSLNDGVSTATVCFDSYGDDDGSDAVAAAEDFATSVNQMVEALKKAVAIRNASRKVKE